jgi:hypothetical protein
MKPTQARARVTIRGGAQPCGGGIQVREGVSQPSIRARRPILGPTRAVTLPALLGTGNATAQAPRRGGERSIAQDYPQPRKAGACCVLMNAAPAVEAVEDGARHAFD